MCLSSQYLLDELHLEHHHAVARKLQVHVLEIVLASALDGDFEVVG